MNNQRVMERVASLPPVEKKRLAASFYFYHNPDKIFEAFPIIRTQTAEGLIGFEIMINVDHGKTLEEWVEENLPKELTIWLWKYLVRKGFLSSD